MDRYFLNIGSNWNDTANWSDTSGGAGGFSVPTTSDNVFFDANSGDCNLNINTRDCQNINFTGYSNTINFSGILRASGNSIIFDSSMSVIGSSELQLITSTSVSITSNGFFFPNNINFLALNGVYTFVDDLDVGSVRFSNIGLTFNGNNIFIHTLLNVAADSNSGTTTFHLKNGSEWIANASTGNLRNNLVINDAGTITITGTVRYATGTLTRVAGTVVTTGSTLIITASCTLDVVGINWNIIQVQGGTITLSSNVNTSSFVSTNPITVNGNTINILNGGSFGSAQSISGTTNVLVQNDATLTGASFCNLPITINSTGDVVFTGTCAFRNLNIVAANSITTTGSTLSSGNGNATWNTAGVTWNNILIGAGTITLNAKLDSNQMTVGFANTVTFQGTHGFETNTFISAPSSTRTINFLATRTYLINTALNLGVSNLMLSLVSTSTGAIFTLHPSATQNVINTNATWIDSSGGQTITTSNGALNNTQNWAYRASSNFFFFFQ